MLPISSRPLFFVAVTFLVLGTAPPIGRKADPEWLVIVPKVLGVTSCNLNMSFVQDGPRSTFSTIVQPILRDFDERVWRI